MTTQGVTGKAFGRRMMGLALASVVLGGGQDGLAQDTAGRRVAFDTVIGVQDAFAETREWPTAVVFDGFFSAELRRHLHASVRPKFWRLNGEWELVLDQASLQYEFRKGSNWRIEAGRFPSPVGLGMTENRPSINAGLHWWHRPYYMPLPELGDGAPMVSLIAATYPNGAVVTTSGDYWDARAALTDLAPVQFWQDDTYADRGANVVVGGGISPAAGLRVGLATASGDLTRAPAGNYRMFNVEAEYAFGYTKVSGEWTRDRFEMPAGDHVARGWTAQAQHTFTPRLFAHARTTRIDSPEVTGPGATSVGRRYTSLDATVGYRVDPELTLKVGYSAIRSWNAPTVDHQAGISLMWTRRWW